MLTNNLRHIRESLMMTQVVLAEKAELSVRTIYNIEQGVHIPMWATKRKILRALKFKDSERHLVWPLDKPPRIR